MKKMKVFFLIFIGFIFIFIIYTIYDLNRNKVFYFGINIEKYKILGTKSYNEKEWKLNKENRKEMLYSYLKEKKYEFETSYEISTYFPSFQNEIKSVLDIGNINGKRSYLVINHENCFQIIPYDSDKLRYMFYYEYYKRKNNLKCDFTYDPYTVRIFSW